MIALETLVPGIAPAYNTGAIIEVSPDVDDGLTGVRVNMAAARERLICPSFRIGS